MSKMYRKPEVYPFNLAVDACRNAIADAGLEIGDIDGIACWPHAAVHVGHGSSAASPVDIKNSLGLKLNWFEAGMGPGQFASIANARRHCGGLLQSCALLPCRGRADRKSVVSGKGVSVRGDLGGRRCIKKKKKRN